MASKGDIQVYNEFIQDIGVFIQTISVACETLVTAAQTCVDNMENDAASLKASKNVLASVQKYQEAIEAAQSLANDLSEERDDLIKYLESLETIEDAGDE